MKDSPLAAHPPDGTIAERLTLCVFGLSLFLSALIMFVLEPMAGKMLLPLVGGTPAGWIVAMAFFQIMLLAGYLIAHLLSRFSPRLQAVLYILLLACGLAFLPPHLDALTTSATPGPLGVFILLCKTIAVPFIALAAGSSTVQRLFTTARHRAAGDPYFLYAASNLGSFAGLLLYPLAIEPLAGLLRQSRHWTLGYAALMAAAALCILLTDKTQNVQKQPEDKAQTPLPAALKMRWLLLAFVPSSLMLGVTTQITADVFSAPMLWVLPLALYLLTLVIAFSRKPLVSATVTQATQHLFVTAAIGLIILQFIGHGISLTPLALHLLCFTGVALSCHMQLTALRPPDSRRHLTQFYLIMALGGALGGILNAFIVPLVLNHLLEYPAVLILSLLLNPLFFKTFKKTQVLFLCASVLCIALYAVLAMQIVHMPHAIPYGTVTAVLLVVGFALLSISPRTAFFGTIFALVIFEFVIPQSTLLRERNFFGVVKVFDRPLTIDGNPYTARYMLHGTTVHGVEVLDPKFKKKALAYYGPSSGIGLVFKHYHPKSVLVIGLGAGELACYSEPDMSMTFIEIDPAVISLAKKYFSFLHDCGAREKTNIVLGDGRLELEKMKNKKFDIIVLDAFSGDSIPVHLLTMEAMVDYMNHLNKGGLIIANISNRYFDLTHPLAKTADLLDLNIQIRADHIDHVTEYFPSLWVVMSPDSKIFASLDADKKHPWSQPVVLPRARVWTDDYSNLLGALIALDPPPLRQPPKTQLPKGNHHAKTY